MPPRRKPAAAEAGAPTNGDAPAFLTSEQILAAKDLEEAVIDVPEWGGKVRVRALSYADLRIIRDKATKNGEFDLGVFEIEMVGASCIDPVFRKDQLLALPAKNRVPIARIVLQVSQMSGLFYGVVADEEVAGAAAGLPA